MSFQLEILTPTKTLMRGQADEVVAPSVSGEVDILPQHTDYLTLLSPGRVIYRSSGKSEEFQITGGVASVQGDRVTILIDSLASEV